MGPQPPFRSPECAHRGRKSWLDARDCAKTLIIPVSLRDRVLPVAAVLLGTLLYHRWSILSGLDLVQADNGDSRFIAFLLEHWNSVAAGTGRWRSPPIFYPTEGTLGYSDALFVMGWVQVLIRLTGLGVFAAMNAQLVLWSALAFTACMVFLRRAFGLSVPACCVGAYFFAFGWPRFAQLVHVQLQFTAALPILALLALVFLSNGTEIEPRRAFAMLAGFVGLAALLLATTTYYAMFFALALTLALLLCVADSAARRQIAAALRRHPLSLVGAGLLLAILLIPVAITYLPMIRLGTHRPWAEVAQFLATPADLGWMGRENLAWGWFFDRFPLQADQKWPEGRIGVGLVVSAAWIGSILWAIRIAARRLAGGRNTPPAREGLAALVILTGAILQLCMLRLPGGLSPWWVIYQGFPGMAGIRAIGRLQLVVMLPMSLGLALMTQRLWYAAQRWVRPALLVALAAAAVEQLGGTYLYSGRQAEMLARQVAAAVPAPCRAFYARAPLGTVPAPPQIHAEADFDAQAYLRANPDVALGWKGTAWEHYVRFGRTEQRFIDPDAATRRRMLLFFYGYTVPLAAVLAGKPAVNGLSGWAPVGYDLDDVLALDVTARVDRWLARAGVEPDRVCIVPVRLDPADLPLTASLL